MFRSLDIASNLKNDILELKKELSSLKSENHLFKVKIRKLQNEISKKDKQIEILIDPDRSYLIKRIISERGATLVVTLRERIKKLEKVLQEKDATVKRLQNDLQTKKLYTVKQGDKKKIRAATASKQNTSIPFFENEYELEEELKALQSTYKSVSLNDIPGEDVEENENKQSKRSISAEILENHKNGVSNNNFDVKGQYDGLPRSHLLSIIENLKSNQNQQRLSPLRRHIDSPESDLERCELHCETPHPEIQQLQNYFMDILDEVDHLKVTISTLKQEQDKTSDVLKQKDSSIEYLAKEIETLRRPLIKNNLPLTKNLRTQHKRSKEEVALKSSSLKLNSIAQTMETKSTCSNKEEANSNVNKLPIRFEHALLTTGIHEDNLAKARREKFQSLLQAFSV